LNFREYTNRKDHKKKEEAINDTCKVAKKALRVLAWRWEGLVSFHCS
jgi:hypothetical protein